MDITLGSGSRDSGSIPDGADCDLCRGNVTRDFEMINTIQRYDKSELIRMVDIEFSELFTNHHFGFLEHTSANPVGTPHLGNLVNSLLGDLISRTTNLRPSYYVNDMGSNFCRYLVAIQNHKRYSEVDDSHQDTIEAKRDALYSRSLNDHQKRIRERALEEVNSVLRILNVRNDFRYIYESSYANQVRSLMQADLKLSSRLFTSKMIPLYISYDLFYRKEIEDTYRTRKVMICGRDHKSYQNSIERCFLEMFDQEPKIEVMYYPQVVHNQLRLSKRKNVIHDLDLDRMKNYIRLFVFKHLNRDKIDFQDLRNEKVVQDLHQLLKLDPVSKQEVLKAIDSIPHEEVHRLKFWIDLKRIIHKLTTTSKYHRFFKMLELLAFRKLNTENLRTVDAYFRAKLLRSLGFVL